MDIAMWGKALRVIPRIDKEQWNRLDVIARWLVATRSAVLIITFIPAAIAGILALRVRAFDPVLWLVMTLGLLMAHATNNLVNDLTDYWKGVDRDNYFRAQYGPQPLEHGLMTIRQLLIYIVVTGLIAVAAGAYLVYVRGGLTLLLMGLGAFFVLFYTFPLKYIGLGEVAVLVVWGPLMIGGGYYVITGSWSWDVAIASMPYALGATTVIFGKHIDKIGADRAKGIRTLPVLLGERNARYVAIGMMLAQYALVLYLVVSGFFTPVLLLVVLAARAFYNVAKVFAQPRPSEAPPDYPEDTWPLWFVAFAFYHNRTFGLLFLLGIIIDTVLRLTLLA
jgi:1,4-dihydroxy-2-naphthoate octaprenyltransferase